MIVRIIKVALAVFVAAGIAMLVYPYYTDDPAWKYNTTTELAGKDIVGTWRVMERSWPNSRRYFEKLPEEALLVLESQKHFRAFNLPLEKASLGRHKGREAFLATGDGIWEIRKNSKAYVINLSFVAGEKHEIEILGNAPPYHLSYPIGGPDSDVVIYLERIGTANLVRLGCDKQ